MINIFSFLGGDVGSVVFFFFLVLLKLASTTHGTIGIFIIGKEYEYMNLQITVCGQPIVSAR